MDKAAQNSPSKEEILSSTCTRDQALAIVVNSRLQHQKTVDREMLRVKRSIEAAKAQTGPQGDHSAAREAVQENALRGIKHLVTIGRHDLALETAKCYGTPKPETKLKVLEGVWECGITRNRPEVAAEAVDAFNKGYALGITVSELGNTLLNPGRIDNWGEFLRTGELGALAREHTRL